MAHQLMSFSGGELRLVNLQMLISEMTITELSSEFLWYTILKGTLVYDYMGLNVISLYDSPPSFLSSIHL